MSTQHTDTTRLAAALEDANKLQRSPLRPIWQGALFGIGSTVGLALALYLLSLLLRPFVNLPFLGDIIRVVEPSLQQSKSFIEPSAETPVMPAATAPSSEPSKTTGHSSIRNNYFALELPGSWSMKIRQQSNASTLVSIAAEGDNAATFAATVTESNEVRSYPDTATVSKRTINGEEGKIYSYSAGAATTTHEAAVTHNGEQYLFTLTADAASGTSLFDIILDSIIFQS